MANRTSAPTALATLPVLLVVGIAAAAFEVIVPRDGRVSVAALITATSAIALLGFFALTRRRLPRAPAAAAFALLPWSAAVGWGVLDRLTTPLAYAPADGLCGTGLVALMMLVVPVGFGLSLGASVALAFALATAARRFDRPIRHAAQIALAIAAIASAFSLPKAFKPDADTYFASLTVVGRMKIGERVTVAGRTLSYVMHTPEAPPEARSTDPTDSTDPRIESDGRASAAPPQPECRLEGAGSPVTVHVPAPNYPCTPIEVRVDPAGDYAFLFYDAVGLNGFAAPVIRTAYRTSDFEAVDFTQARVGSRLAAPLGWRAGAYGATIVASLLLLVAGGIAARAARRPERPAHHRGDGWCDLPNLDTPIRVPAAVTLPRGPVLLGGAAEGATGYRDGASLSFATARSGDAEATSDRVTGLRAIALTVAVFGALPLVLARIYGI